LPLGEAPTHPVDRVRELTQLVAEAGRDRPVEVAALDPGRRRCDPAQAARDQRCQQRADERADEQGQARRLEALVAHEPELRGQLRVRRVRDQRRQALRPQRQGHDGRAQLGARLHVPPARECAPQRIFAAGDRSELDTARRPRREQRPVARKDEHREPMPVGRLLDDSLQVARRDSGADLECRLEGVAGRQLLGAVAEGGLRATRHSSLDHERRHHGHERERKRQPDPDSDARTHRGDIPDEAAGNSRQWTASSTRRGRSSTASPP